MSALPIIRLEIAHMRQAIQVALSERSFAIDSNINSALDKFLSANNIQQIIDAEVESAINSIVKEEASHFFKYGDGSKALRESVRNMLNGGQP